MVGTKVVKCPGRFPETREKVFEAIELVIDGRKDVSEEDLVSIWDLCNIDLVALDGRDPYYEPTQDTVRKAPHPNYLSLVPLFPSTHIIDPSVREKYVLSRGVDPRVASRLAVMGNQGLEFYTRFLGKDPKDLHITRDITLGGYVIGANVGVGTLSDGGPEGGGTRSDSPFLLEIYKKSEMKRGAQASLDLAAVVGFWAEGNTMLVSQMQSCKNARLPEEIPFGNTCLSVAEKVARELGFTDIACYTARAHPYFLQHPDGWERMAGTFTSIWDGAARKLGYEGSRSETQVYKKNIGVRNS